jgi:hypothetical protein
LLQRSKIQKAKQGGQETNKAEGKKERKKQETVPTYPKSLSQEATAAAGYLMQKEKSCQSIKAFLLLHNNPVFTPKKWG